MGLYLDMMNALDEQGEYGNADDAASEVGAERVQTELVDETRWGVIIEEIYKRGDEYVSVTYESPGGESEVPFEPEVKEVVPTTVTKTVYTPV